MPLEAGESDMLGWLVKAGQKINSLATLQMQHRVKYLTETVGRSLPVKTNYIAADDSSNRLAH